MEAHGRMAGAKDLVLRRSLLLYEDRSGAALATVHEVRQKDGKGKGHGRAEIGAGRPLTSEALAELVKDLSGQPQRREILPGHLLYADAGRVLWYRRAERRPVFFHTGRREFDAATNGKNALFPPLLFLAKPGNLWVWALRQDGRPDADTPVYRAPFLNIYEDGHMCAGTSKLPLAVGYDVKLFEKAFFETTFTHSNYRDHLTAHPGGHDGLWTALVDPELRQWDPAWLLPVKNGKNPVRVGEVVNR